MSTLTTTVKVDICSFSEYRMYPGRGTKFASRDGKVYFFLNSKTSALGHKKIKPIKLRWTQSWRRANKKMQSSTIQRRRTKKTARFQKAIVGLTLEELKSRRLAHNNTSDKAIKDAKMKARKGKQPVAPVSTIQAIQGKYDKKPAHQQDKTLTKTVSDNQAKKQEQTVKAAERPKKIAEQSQKVPEQLKNDSEQKRHEQPTEELPKTKAAKPSKQEQNAPAPHKTEEVKPKKEKVTEEPPKKEKVTEEPPKKTSFMGKLFGRMR